MHGEKEEQETREGLEAVDSNTESFGEAQVSKSHFLTNAKKCEETSDNVCEDNDQDSLVRDSLIARNITREESAIFEESSYNKGENEMIVEDCTEVARKASNIIEESNVDHDACCNDEMSTSQNLLPNGHVDGDVISSDVKLNGTFESAIDEKIVSVKEIGREVTPQEEEVQITPSENKSSDRSYGNPNLPPVGNLKIPEANEDKSYLDDTMVTSENEEICDNSKRLLTDTQEVKEEQIGVPKTEDARESTKFTLKPDAKEFVPRTYGYPEPYPLNQPVHFFSMPPNFLPIPMVNHMGNPPFNPAFLPPGIPINFLPSADPKLVNVTNQNYQTKIAEAQADHSSEERAEETDNVNAREIPKDSKLGTGQKISENTTQMFAGKNEIDIAKIVSKLEQAAKEQRLNEQRRPCNKTNGRHHRVPFHQRNKYRRSCGEEVNDFQHKTGGGFKGKASDGSYGNRFGKRTGEDKKGVDDKKSDDDKLNEDEMMAEERSVEERSSEGRISEERFSTERLSEDVKLKNEKSESNIKEEVIESKLAEDCDRLPNGAAFEKEEFEGHLEKRLSQVNKRMSSEENSQVKPLAQKSNENTHTQRRDTNSKPNEDFIKSGVQTTDHRGGDVKENFPGLVESHRKFGRRNPMRTRETRSFSQSPKHSRKNTKTYQNNFDKNYIRKSSYPQNYFQQTLEQNLQQKSPHKLQNQNCYHQNGQKENSRSFDANLPRDVLARNNYSEKLKKTQNGKALKSVEVAPRPDQIKRSNVDKKIHRDDFTWSTVSNRKKKRNRLVESNQDLGADFEDPEENYSEEPVEIYFAKKTDEDRLTLEAEVAKKIETMSLETVPKVEVTSDASEEKLTMSDKEQPPETTVIDRTNSNEAECTEEKEIAAREAFSEIQGDESLKESLQEEISKTVEKITQTTVTNKKKSKRVELKQLTKKVMVTDPEVLKPKDFKNSLFKSNDRSKVKGMKIDEFSEKPKENLAAHVEIKEIKNEEKTKIPDEEAKVDEAEKEIEDIAVQKNLEAKENKKPKKKKKATKSTQPSHSNSSSCNKTEDTYDFLLNDVTLDEEKTNLELSKELEKVIQKGLYNNFGEKMKKIEEESTFRDAFFKTISGFEAMFKQISPENRKPFKAEDLGGFLRPPIGSAKKDKRKHDVEVPNFPLTTYSDLDATPSTSWSFLGEKGKTIQESNKVEEGSKSNLGKTNGKLKNKSKKNCTRTNEENFPRDESSPTRTNLELPEKENVTRQEVVTGGREENVDGCATKGNLINLGTDSKNVNGTLTVALKTSFEDSCDCKGGTSDDSPGSFRDFEESLSGSAAKDSFTSKPVDAVEIFLELSQVREEKDENDFAQVALEDSSCGSDNSNQLKIGCDSAQINEETKEESVESYLKSKGETLEFCENNNENRENFNCCVKAIEENWEIGADEENKDETSLYPITKAVKDWIERTREATPEVEIFRSPCVGGNGVNGEDIFNAGAGEENDEYFEDDVVIFNKETLNISEGKRLEGVEGIENDNETFNFKKDTIEKKDEVREEEETVEVYESKYGTNEDYLKIMAEIEEKKRNGELPPHGNLPYRAICCSLM